MHSKIAVAAISVFALIALFSAYFDMQDDTISDDDNASFEEGSSARDPVYDSAGNATTDDIDRGGGRENEDMVTVDEVEGTISAAFFEDRYTLRGTFENLPRLSNNEFYEGWIIRQSPHDRISTGVVPFENNHHIATFGSGRDLTDYTIFELTRERSDGDPSPGKVVSVQQIDILQGSHAF